ncbi:sugar O-acetyltransferase [Microvirga sp. STR05]|uniref:Acetyltransferase n=1 Tax=Hymenobacter duratus TaxID=2771356 RepID=A0ABR8JEI3_9BACT|nr:sugar O-acetyltransferase [Hymenobacter duratus]MBD2715264.1 sugar O-acetyltransferase [Hymenobacter duratus]MBR7950171.1 sugar O-acetyltransferase [Microvirga sp. STR05]
MPLTDKEKMLSGELYLANDPELVAERLRAKELCHRYNQEPVYLNRQVLAELLGYETDAHLEAPLRCDYGYNIRLGRNVYANYNLTILDCALVTIGDNVFMAPNVVLSTAGHPVEVEPRIAGWEFARPITIGDNVWLGAGVLVMPGVTIGAGTTIGAGSVVTRDIPAGVVAVGNPCRVLRPV